jgi:putative ABC transport system substrate-binding protein
VRTRRRWLVTGLAIGILQLCPALRGQEQPYGGKPRIGILGYGVDASMLESFRQGMLELGRIEQRDYVVVYKASQAPVEELSARAAELVGLNVDLIIASGTPSVRAAQKATSTIPVVMVGVGLDPVRLGLVQSLARPGGNITGVAALGVELIAKRLQLFRDMVPGLTRVSVLMNPTNPGNVLSLAEFRAAASTAGVKVQPVMEAKDGSGLSRALTGIAGSPPPGMYIVWDAMLQAHATEIAEFAVAHRIATLAAIKEHVQSGALMSYGAKLPDQWKRTAQFADRVLKGSKPATMPVEQPTAFELVINRKAARALGLTIPPELLILADKVIN